jgi:hypothetical protein
MANIIVTSKKYRYIYNYYYPDFINVIINNEEFVISRSDDKVCIEDIDNIQFTYCKGDDLFTTIIHCIDSNIKIHCYFKDISEFLYFKNDIENILYTYKFNIKTIISSVTSTIV